MAAVAATLAVVLGNGDVVVMPADGYYTARALAGSFFRRLGVEVRLAPTANDAQASLLHGAKLLWLESPSNPGLDVCDIAKMAQLAHDVQALVVVDNTTPTVLGQRPLELGADFSLASDTKAMTGHSDIILGHVAAKDAAWAEKLRAWRSQMGSIPGPMEVWLAHRSLATLDVRLERQCSNALAVAQFLPSRSEVLAVRYPGLASDPAHDVAARQMRRFGMVVSFCLQDRQKAERFLRSCKLIWEATSFGGVHTTAERRGRWGGDDVPEGFIRMSVGCEDTQDLIDDLSQALASL
jgi:cystathionine gamma-lyase